MTKNSRPACMPRIAGNDTAKLPVRSTTSSFLTVDEDTFMTLQRQMHNVRDFVR